MLGTEKTHENVRGCFLLSEHSVKIGFTHLLPLQPRTAYISTLATDSKGLMMLLNKTLPQENESRII